MIIQNSHNIYPNQEKLNVFLNLLKDMVDIVNF